MLDMSTRRAASCAAAALVAVVTTGAARAGYVDRSPSQDATRPNVLIIVTDDQRDGLGVMRATRRLIADKGYRFENAVATTPLCCPARASIFTGRYAHNTGVRTEADASELDQGSTLQYYLQQAGYETALFGKYLNTWKIHNPPPYFDRWAFFGRSRNTYTQGLWNVQGTVKTIPAYSTRYLARKAEDFVTRQDARVPDRPWFMYVATTAPHNPFTPEKRYRKAPVGRLRETPAMHERDRSDKPPYVRVQLSKPTSGPRTRRRQFRTLLSVDDLVRGVFARLRRTREIRDTLVFFISDNGYLWGEHGLTRKSVPYTPSVEVPFLMRVPQTIRQVVDDRLVANIDIAPTVMDVLDLAPTGPAMDGRSLLDDHARSRILMEYYDQKNPHGDSRFQAPTWASLRTPDYQYVEYYRDDDTTVSFREYYDAHADPYQLDNVLGDRDPSNDLDAVTLEFLSQQLQRDRRCSGTTGESACP